MNYTVMLSFIKKIIQKIIESFGFKVVRKGEPKIWENDQEFLRLYKQIKDKTLVSKDRCFSLFQFARYACSLKGEVAECGVYKGGTAKLIARVCNKKTIHLFDTFEGMPEEDPEVDLHKKGEFSDADLPSVKKFLVDCQNLKFYPGFFPDTTRPITSKRFCFVHVDVDIYQSAKDCLNFFYSRLVSGGIMVFDDYGWRMCPGVKKAVDEFLANKKEKPIIVAQYQGVIIKQ